MAKGFTVKAKTPSGSNKPTQQEWDYDKAREMIKGKTVVLCLPGRTISYKFFLNGVKLIIIIASRSKHPDLAR